MAKTQSNDLVELNTILFDTLRGIKTGEVTTEQATSVIGVSNAVVNNAKVQLAAMKMCGNKVPVSLLGLSANNGNKIPPKIEDRYDAGMAVATSNGCTNIAAAMVKLGKSEYNMQVDALLGKE